MHLDYVGIRVRDLLKSLRFYARGLGLLEIRRGTMEEGGTWILLEDQVSRQRLELTWYPPGSRYDTPWKSGEELDHLGIRTANPEALARHLKEAGATEVGRAPTNGTSRSILLEDPNGIVLELLPVPDLAEAVPLP